MRSFCFFFFSSRRRHTRWPRDWSSDVCSSDLGGIKERMTDSPPAMAMTDMVRRSLNTFIDMQHDFLTTASKQADHWLHAIKAGKPYGSDHMIEMAREAMDHFVRAQKKFLDVIAEETNHATSGRPVPKMKKTEISKLAHEAANAFLEAQKKMLDVAGHQMNVNLKVAERAMEILKPLRLPIASLTGESVKGFVEAEKALIDNIVKHGRPMPAARPKAHRKPAPRTRKSM